MPRDAITTNKIAAAVGPFSAAVRVGDLVYLSGQVGQDPATGKLVSGGIDAQVEQLFRNIEAVLGAAGMTLDHVIKANVYLTDMKNFAAMNAVYGTKFSKPYPARTTVAVAALPLSADVEIEVIAR